MKMTLRFVLSILVLSAFIMAAPCTAFSATQMFEKVLQALPQQDRDAIISGMSERHIQLMEEQKGLDILTATEKDELASAMAAREVPILQELNAGKDPGAVPAYLMEKMRAQVMGAITNDIVSHNQDLCRPIVQPYMSKEVSKKIQVSTIPMFTSGMIERVQAHFKKN